MIEKISLKNWKSHENTELEFKPGVNIIVGSMGVGKSSILQAISFGLFGTFSELKSKDIKITDLITRGSTTKSAEIELALKTDKQILKIKRVIQEGKSTEAIARGKDGELLAGTNPTQVSDYLKNILKLDEDLFLRTVYSKQNEIDLFLQLTPGERKKRLDQLMALDKFEDARKNCIKLINRLDDKRLTKENFLRETNLVQLKSEILALSQELENSKKEQEKIRQEFIVSRDKKEDLEQQLISLRKKQNHQNRLEGRKSIVLQQIEEFDKKLKGKDLDKSLSLLLLHIKDIKTKINEIQKTKSSTKSDLEKNRSLSLELEKQIGSIEGKNSDLQEQIRNLEAIKRELEGLQSTDGKFDVIEQKLSDLQKSLEQKILQKQTILGELTSLQKHLSELQGAESVCPVCLAKLETYTKEQLIAERKQKILDLVKNSSAIGNEIDSIKANLENLKEKLDKQKILLQKLDTFSDLLAQERETAIQLSELEGKRETLQSVVQHSSKKLEQLDEEVLELDEEHAILLEEKALYELKDKYELLRKELQDIEKQLAGKIDSAVIRDMEKQFQEMIGRAQQLKSRDTSTTELCKEKEKRLSDLKQKQSKAAELQEDIGKLYKKIEFLNQFKNALLVTQSSLRQELIQAVNEVMNSIWEALYPYDKWGSIRLDATETDYTLQIKDSEGNWLPVAGFASGGERMLASLALRIAFAKVLAPNLSLLILDEPTHNLDDNAISTLIEVIQEKLVDTLDQVFIVTHDEKLAEAGQNIIKI